jgi:hypothetical protein
MTDTKAPERIWAGPTPVYRREEEWTWNSGDWDLDGETVIYGELAEPYARADLLTALEAERDAQAKEIERLRKRVEAADRLAFWVEGFIEDGCPKCGGDCSAANPPVAYCPIRDAMADLAAYRATEGEA